MTHFVGYVGLLAVTMTWGQALVFVAIHKGVQGLCLGCSFAPNHKGMPMLAAHQAADPLLRQALTSRNIRGGPFIDAALGGLNYQIEHHLFPSMPRANLRHAQPVVQKSCADRGIAYAQSSALASYTTSIRHLHDVGAGLRSTRPRLADAEKGRPAASHSPARRIHPCMWRGSAGARGRKTKPLEAVRSARATGSRAAPFGD